MKRLLRILFAIALMAGSAVLGIDAGARENGGPERGKMGWGSGTPALTAPSQTKEATLEFAGEGEPCEYRGPERGKMGLSAVGSPDRHPTGKTRREVKPETK
jgi:hypothetical protein